MIAKIHPSAQPETHQIYSAKKQKFNIPVDKINLHLKYIIMNTYR